MIPIETLRLIYQDAAIGIALVSSDGTFLEVNDAFCELVGYSKPEMTRRNFQSITHPDDVRDDVQLVKQCLTGERDHYAMVKRYITKVGKAVWVTLVVSAVRTDAGEFQHFIAQAIPIANGAQGVHIEKAGSTVRIHAPDDNSIHFLELNWKWLLGAFFAVNAAIVGFLIQYNVQSYRFEQSEKKIKNIELTLGEVLKEMKKRP